VQIVFTRVGYIKLDHDPILCIPLLCYITLQANRDASIKKILRVSESFSVYHQEFFTAHTAMVYVIQHC